MDYKFLSVDLSAATFEGLSLSHHRKIALLGTITIWLGVGYAFYLAALRLDALGWAEDVASVFLTGALIHYIAGGQFIMYSAARALARVTPLGVLYRQDKTVLDKAKRELLSIAQEVQFRDYLEYGKINPAIRSRSSLVVMAHQKKGDLNQWIGSARNLKQLANLVYQIYLVEQILVQDIEPELQPF